MGIEIYSLKQSSPLKVEGLGEVYRYTHRCRMTSCSFSVQDRRGRWYVPADRQEASLERFEYDFPDMNDVLTCIAEYDGEREVRRQSTATPLWYDCDAEHGALVGVIEKKSNRWVQIDVAARMRSLEAKLDTFLDAIFVVVVGLKAKARIVHRLLVDDCPWYRSGCVYMDDMPNEARGLYDAASIAALWCRRIEGSETFAHLRGAFCNGIDQHTEGLDFSPEANAWDFYLVMTDREEETDRYREAARRDYEAANPTDAELGRDPVTPDEPEPASGPRTFTVDAQVLTLSGADTPMGRAQEYKQMASIYRRDAVNLDNSAMDAKAAAYEKAAWAEIGDLDKTGQRAFGLEID
jgi:hypothetical protein